MSTNKQGVLQGLDDCGTIGNVGRPGGSNSSGLTRDRGKGEKNQAMKKVLFHFYFNVVGFIIAQGQCSSHDPQGNRIV